MPDFLNILPSQYNPPMSTPFMFPSGTGPGCNPCMNYTPITPENNPCSGSVNPVPYTTNPMGQPTRIIPMQPPNPYSPGPTRPILGQPIFPMYPTNPDYPSPCKPTMISPLPVMPLPIRAQPITPIDMRPPEPCGGTSPFPLLPAQPYQPWNNSGAAKLPYMNMMASGYPLPQVSNLYTNPIPLSDNRSGSVLMLRRNVLNGISERCPLPVAA